MGLHTELLVEDGPTMLSCFTPTARSSTPHAHLAFHLELGASTLDRLNVYNRSAQGLDLVACERYSGRARDAGMCPSYSAKIEEVRLDMYSVPSCAC